MKILIFVQELISVILTPFVLWFSLPLCAPDIVDFFREFSVHVDGRGYVCSFAEFNFERHGNVKFGAPPRAQDKKMVSNEGKMEKSFLNFKVEFFFSLGIYYFKFADPHVNLGYQSRLESDRSLWVSLFDENGGFQFPFPISLHSEKSAAAPSRWLSAWVRRRWRWRNCALCVSRWRDSVGKCAPR